MSILRQHTVLLEHAGPLAAAHAGPAFRLTPSDADAVPDVAQELVAVVALRREVDPGDKVDATPVRLVVDGSFDGVHWIRVARASLAVRDRALDRVVPLGAVPPLLRARLVPDRDDAAGQVAAYVAVGSTAPYRAVRVAA